MSEGNTNMNEKGNLPGNKLPFVFLPIVSL